MRCKKCHTELMDGELFCHECGTKIEDTGSERTDEENKIVKPEEQASEGEIMGNGKTEAEIKGTAPESGERENGGKGKLKKTLMIGGAAAAAVLAVTALFMFRDFGAKDGKNRDIMQEILYVKDGDILEANLNKTDEKPMEYASGFVKDKSDLLGWRISYQTVSPDGKYKLIPVKYNREHNSFTLYYQKGKEKQEKISADISRYELTADNRIVYLKNKDLFAGEIEGKAEKIASDVVSYYVSDDGKRIIWAEKKNSGGYNDYYKMGINGDEKKEKLISDAFLVDCTRDLSAALFEKNGDLYFLDGGVKAEKLVDESSDIKAVYNIDLENKSFFYMTVESTEESFMDSFFEDDMAAADAKMERPTYPKRPSLVFDNSVSKADQEKLYAEAWEQYEKDQEQYEKDSKAYKEKEYRDEIRKSIKDTKNPISAKKLYYYANGEGTQIAEDVLSGSLLPLSREEKESHNFSGSMLYAVKNSDAVKKVKLSQLLDGTISTEDAEKQSLKPFNQPKYMLYVNGAAKELDVDGRKLDKVCLDAENQSLYLFVKEWKDDVGSETEDKGEVLRLQLGIPEAEPESYETEVDALNLVHEGNVYYMKDKNKEENAADLYRNEERVAYDVSTGFGVEKVPDSSAVIYKESGDEEVLYLLSGEEAAELGENVTSYKVLGETCIFMLSDCDNDRHEGTLLYYDGSETLELDDDVQSYFIYDSRTDDKRPEEWYANYVLQYQIKSVNTGKKENSGKSSAAKATTAAATEAATAALKETVPAAAAEAWASETTAEYWKN